MNRWAVLAFQLLRQWANKWHRKISRRVAKVCARGRYNNLLLPLHTFLVPQGMYSCMHVCMHVCMSACISRKASLKPLNKLKFAKFIPKGALQYILQFYRLSLLVQFFVAGGPPAVYPPSLIPAVAVPLPVVTHVGE